jgi:hypothetical protein
MKKKILRSHSAGKKNTYLNSFSLLVLVLLLLLLLSQQVHLDIVGSLIGNEAATMPEPAAAWTEAPDENPQVASDGDESDARDNQQSYLLHH